MRVTKYGHCCLLIEESLATGSLRILTDPGVFSSGYDALQNIDIVLITHEHGDHFHIPGLKLVLANNADCKVITNSAVAALLAKEGIAAEILEEGGSKTEQGIALAAYGHDHAVIYPTIPMVQNTGYFIADRFFFPGDAFTIPGRAVDILALPIAGPWMKIAEAIDYAKAIKPKIWIPVHDAILKSEEWGYRISTLGLNPQEFPSMFLESGKTVEL